jgi:hypothetical protein
MLSVSYIDSFTFLYVDDNRTSQETHVRASAACYRDIITYFTFCLLTGRAAYHQEACSLLN